MLKLVFTGRRPATGVPAEVQRMAHNTNKTDTVAAPIPVCLPRPRQVAMACLLTVIGAAVIGRGQTSEWPEHIDFNQHIKPILSDRCFACHGPDEKARRADLRLDDREAAFGTGRDGVPLIEPGNPEKSLVYLKISATDPEERMPPAEAKLSLSREEIGLIKAWIARGAQWKRHWAFVPLEETTVPEVEGPDRPMNPIDRFVRDRLKKEGLDPAPPAGRERWLRRVTFDLRGLPPSMEEIDAFLADTSDAAYERVVDRLLGATDFGERMAVIWMDAARYADTHGYQADRYRPVWPWRDWVIDAFNRNLPYDQFVTWQIAGDLLPNATQEQRLATAFNRLHMQTEEGGSIPEEFRVAYVTDRVETMGNAILGLTVQCARCHDHKYDPISQKDYYRLFGFFNNIDESGQTSYFTDAIPVPTLLLADPTKQRELERARAAVRQKEEETARLKRQLKPAFREWLNQPPEDLAIRGQVGDFSFEHLEENLFFNATTDGPPGKAFEGPELVEGKRGRGLLLNGENGVSFGETGTFSRVDPFTVAFWVKTTLPLEQAVMVHRTKAPLDAGSRGYEMSLHEGRVRLGLTHMWPQHSVTIESLDELPRNEWVHLAMVYDGSSRAEGLKLYWNGREAATRTIRNHLFKDILYERVEVELTIGARFRDSGFKGGNVDEFNVFARALTPLEIRHLHVDTPMSALVNPTSEGRDAERHQEELFEYYLANHSEPFQRHLAELRELRRRENEIVNPIPEIMVMEEMASPRPAHVLRRGEYDAPGERVYPGTPEKILAFGNERPLDRRGLADWLTDPRNPLTARVAVNRFWQVFFGEGLVRTPGDFGSQGELPTHPRLLDWLAKDFMDAGWDIKRLVKQIVTSATYRQSSKSPSGLRARDPENRLLGRGPSHRLPAEMIRDNALSVSGLLVRHVGGPSVKPYQPPGLWKEKSGKTYKPDPGSGLYRKSLYTFWKRTSPPPSMMLFDAAERNVCSVKRQRTNTPLQPLLLLNDVQFTEAARHIGRRMLTEGGSRIQDQVRFAFRLLTSRLPDPAETEILIGLYREQLALFREDGEAAKELLRIGKSPPAPGLAADRHAAATVLASALLNFDETIMKR